jgi:DNA-directed RNA polymerase specialized sigma24 family protein
MVAAMTKRDRSVDRPMWVHLETRHRDVLALARMHGGWRELIRRGWMVEDLEQEILLRVLTRQEEHAPYDGKRAGLAKYLVTLTSSILLNLLEGTRTLKATSEQLGVVQVVDGERVEVDASQAAVGTLLPSLSRAGRASVQRMQEEDEGGRQGKGRARGRG